VPNERRTMLNRPELAHFDAAGLFELCEIQVMP